MGAHRDRRPNLFALVVDALDTATQGTKATRELERSVICEFGSRALFCFNSNFILATLDWTELKLSTAQALAGIAGEWSLTLDGGRAAEAPRSAANGLNSRE